MASLMTGSKARSGSEPMRAQYLGRSLMKLALSQAGERGCGRPNILSTSQWTYISAFLLAVICISNVSTEKTSSSSVKISQDLTNSRLINSEEGSESESLMRDNTYQLTLLGRDSLDNSNSMGHLPTPTNQYSQKMIEESTRLWVFGYGSLVWKTGFKYTSKKVGYITEFVRRFWQGDTIHRGTKHKPGRVATLEENQSGHVWGVAFELTGRDEIDVALEHLGMRECILGGYTIRMVSFYPRDDTESPIDTLVFVANPENNNYLGSASISQLTEEIIDSKGNAGHNVEYVTRLADFFRQNVPSMDDPHLLELDTLVRQSLIERSIDLNTLLSNTLTNYNYMYKTTNSNQEELENCNCRRTSRSDEEQLIADRTSEINNNDESQKQYHTYVDQFPHEVDLFEDTDS